MDFQLYHLSILVQNQIIRSFCGRHAKIEPLLTILLKPKLTRQTRKSKNNKFYWIFELWNFAILLWPLSAVLDVPLQSQTASWEVSPQLRGFFQHKSIGDSLVSHLETSSFSQFLFKRVSALWTLGIRASSVQVRRGFSREHHETWYCLSNYFQQQQSLNLILLNLIFWFEISAISNSTTTTVSVFVCATQKGFSLRKAFSLRKLDPELKTPTMHAVLSILLAFC